MLHEMKGLSERIQIQTRTYQFFLLLKDILFPLKLTGFHWLYVDHTGPMDHLARPQIQDVLPH